MDGHVLYLLLLSLPIAPGQSESAEVDSTCPNGADPVDCSQKWDACSDTTCVYYTRASCRLDPCSDCSAAFYDDETGTKLKCDGERLQCTTCFSQDGSPCGGPGEPVETQECAQYQVCGAFSATFIFGGTPVPVFYRGCIPSDSLDDGGPSCYSDAATLEEHLSVTFGAAQDLTGGYGCVCTEDYCNDFELYSYEKEAIASCVDDFGIWFNPGEFRFISDCHASFCGSDGEFACRFEAIGCESEESSYDHGEYFRSGYGDCVCDDGDIRCEAGDPEDSGLVCYVASGQLKPDIGFIEFCEADSICVVGSTTIPLLGSPFTTYLKRCVQREELNFDGDCTMNAEDVPGLAAPNSLAVHICKCESNFCNEFNEGMEPLLTENECEFRGKTYQHNDEVRKDECNLCKCYNGAMLCTEVPCNGLQCYKCYESTDGGPGDCGIVFCQEGEVCVAGSTEYSGFFASYEFTQGCVNSEDVPLNDMCIEDVDTGVEFGLAPDGIQEVFIPRFFIDICNETLCNTVDRWQRICHPDTASEGPLTTPPPKVCYDEIDPTIVYSEGEEAIFGCRLCTCSGHLDFGQWNCQQICTEITETTEPSTGGSCSFGSSYPKYDSGTSFASGCGACTCVGDRITCVRDECPDLFCAVGIVPSKNVEFCEDESLCLTQESSIPELGILIFERFCLPEVDWPYNDTITQDPAFLGDYPGEAFICSESGCNIDGYSQALPEGCDFEDTRYDHQEEFPPDECNICVCLSGTVHCTREPCNGPPCFAHHYEENFPFFPPTPTNVTCFYDEVCVSVSVNLMSGGSGEESGCVEKSSAPAPGQCTDELSVINPLFALPVVSGTLCTILEEIITTTSPTETTTITFGDSTTSPSSETTQPPATPTEPAKNGCVDERGTKVAIGENIVTDSCSCLCRKVLGKSPTLSCDCQDLEVTMVFKEDFSTVADSIDEFSRTVTEELAGLLGVRQSDIKVEVFEGSIVVIAKITSPPPNTEDLLQNAADGGSFTVEHKGVELRAESIEVMVDQGKRTATEPPDAKPAFFTIIVTVAVIIGVLAILVILFAVLTFLKRRQKPAFTAFQGNYPQRPSQDQTLPKGPDQTNPTPVIAPDTHDYATPPDEFEPEDKNGLQQDDHRGVPNNYQSSLDFCLDSIEDVNYHKSIDLNGPEDGVDPPPPYMEVMDFDNPAFGEDGK